MKSPTGEGPFSHICIPSEIIRNGIHAFVLISLLCSSNQKGLVHVKTSTDGDLPRNRLRTSTTSPCQDGAGAQIALTPGTSPIMCQTRTTICGVTAIGSVKKTRKEGILRSGSSNDGHRIAGKLTPRSDTQRRAPETPGRSLQPHHDL